MKPEARTQKAKVTNARLNGTGRHEFLDTNARMNDAHSGRRK
jgi:hypothetical protein